MTQRSVCVGWDDQPGVIDAFLSLLFGLNLVNLFCCLFFAHFFSL
jgi:hypothetical protein